MKKLLIFIGLLGLSSMMLAAQFFCPNSLKLVNLGDSVQHVVQICGKPTQLVKKPKTSQNQKIIWVYVMRKPQGGQGATLYLLFQDSVLLAIRSERSVAFMHHTKTLAQLRCLGGMVKPGDRLSTVTTVCGPPMKQLIAQHQHVAGVASVRHQSEQALVYQRNRNLPARIFVFVDGKLARVD